MNVTKNILSGVIAVAVFGLFATVFAWTGPTAAPAGNNTAAPINTSALTQTKTGNLAITGVDSSGAVYLNALKIFNGNLSLGPTAVPAGANNSIYADGDVCAGVGADQKCLSSSASMDDLVGDEVTITDSSTVWYNNTNRNILVNGGISYFISGARFMVNTNNAFPSGSTGWSYKMGGVIGDNVFSFIVPPGYYYKIKNLGDYVKIYHVKRVSL